MPLLRYGGRDVDFRLDLGRVGVIFDLPPTKLPASWVPTGETVDRFRIYRTSGNAVEIHGSDLSPTLSGGLARVYTTSDDREPLIATGDLFVRFHPAASAAAKALVIGSYPLEEAWGGVILNVKGSDPLEVAHRLQDNNNVVIAEPDLASRGPKVSAFAIHPRQWHLHNTGNVEGSTDGVLAGADARVTDAWDLAGRGSAQVVVACLDNGFDLRHRALIGTGARVVAPWDFVTGDRPDPNDLGPFVAAHGTSMASLVVGAPDEEAEYGGCPGVAPESSLMPMRFGSLTGRHVAEWFDRATKSGAWVINCSWGPAANCYPLWTIASEAIARCARHGRGGNGAVICFAAGNEGRDIDDPASGSLNGFAVHPDVITVAASTSNDDHPDYSNFGKQIAVCAPSSGAQTEPIWSADPVGPDGLDPLDYGPWLGQTSAACAITAGVAALVLAANPGLTAKQVRSILKQTARPLLNGGGHSPLFGHGCVDAAAAVAKARQLL